jgi:hypothetical protein
MEGVFKNKLAGARTSFPWMRITYSDRTESRGYFLLALPDGNLATQYNDERDKVVLDSANMTRDALSNHHDFDLRCHVRKWIAGVTYGDGFACDRCSDDAQRKRLKPARQ